MSRLQIDDEDVVAEDLLLRQQKKQMRRKKTRKLKLRTTKKVKKTTHQISKKGSSDGVVGAIGIVPLKRNGRMKRKKINLLCVEDMKTISKQQMIKMNILPDLRAKAVNGEKINSKNALDKPLEETPDSNFFQQQAKVAFFSEKVLTESKQTIGTLFTGGILVYH